MISKQKIFFIIITALFLVSLGVNIIKLVPETNNYNNYIEGLRSYNNNEYSMAYHYFGKVSRFSRIKSAAVYRQALCANRLSDTKTEIKKYKEVIRHYPNSELATRSKYLKAQQFYNIGEYKKSEKDFKKILSKYPNTDYAIAAYYYLGSIQLEKSKKIKNPNQIKKANQKSVKFFKTYLKKSPEGKYAINCIQKWISIETNLNNEDNLLVAQIYQLNNDYKNSDKYLKNASFNIAWPYMVKSAYNSKKYLNVKYITEEGLKNKNSDKVVINENIDDKTENATIYQAIDLYLKVSDSPKNSISYLMSIAKTTKGADYLLYKWCKNQPEYRQEACYNTLYYKFPNGQFAADSLSNIIYNKIKKQDYYNAQKLGKIHLSKFKDTNSAPRVLFWLAKTAERNKNYEKSRNYYRNLIKRYPDDYYAYQSFINLNRFRHIRSINLNIKPVEFPYNNSSYGLINELIKVKDYGLINQLFKKDNFIQSWLLYQQGDYASSARIARDAMDKLQIKPSRFDLRWRLVYPIHYYEEIIQNSKEWKNDSALILSIIREESYFNESAQSHAGARGLMQLMPLTAKEAANKTGYSLPNIKLLDDPYINIKLGNIYFAELKRKLLNKDFLAVLSYNGGIGSVSKWKNNLNYYDFDEFIEQIPYPETQNYFKKVYRSYWNYVRIYDGIKF